MPFTRAADLTVAYETAGPERAPVLLLANSLGTSMHLWSGVVAALSAEYRVVRYDMRGHGLTSDGGPNGGRIEVLADDLITLLDALGIASAHVAGLSIGGMVAQSAAVRCPSRIASVVLIGTGSRLGTRAAWDERIDSVRRDGMAAVVEGVVERWFTPETHALRPELVDGFRTMLLRAPPAGYIAGCAAVRDADLRRTDAAIRCPALVIAGAADPVAPPSVGRAMCDAIPGAEMRVVDGAAHLVPVERPEPTVDAMRAFLAGVGERAISGGAAAEAAS